MFDNRLSDTQVADVEAWMLNFSSSFCPIGQQFSFKNQACVDCPQGSFKDTASSSSCSPCPSGTTTTSAGSTESSACTSVVCPAGQEPTVLMFCASSLSMSCPSGSVIRVNAASYGQSTYQMIFSSCPMPTRLVFRRDTYIDVNITSDLSICNGQSSCSPSLTMPDPAPGYQKGYYVQYSCTITAVNAALLCKNCSQDYYKSLVGSTSCVPCAAGYSTLAATGATSCTLISPTPPVVGGLIGYYTAQSWGLGKPSGVSNQWTDLSPMRNHLTASTGTVTGLFQVVTSVEAPAYVAGGASEQLQWPKSTAAFNGTQLVVARYNGPNRNAIISCSNGDLWGFYQSKAGISYRCGMFGSPSTQSISNDLLVNKFFLQTITTEVTRIDGRFWSG